MEQHNIIYRVGVSGLHCRSSVELVTLRVTALKGVEAASIDSDHVLTVFADGDVVETRDIVRTLIEVGALPTGAMSLAELDEAAGAADGLVGATACTELDLDVASHSEIAPDVAWFAQPVVEPVAEPTLVVAPGPEAASAPEPLIVPSPEVTPTPAFTEIEESIKADMAIPRVAVSPRAALVQRIKVVVADDYYPNRIEVIPGVPVDIEFSEGHGCLARVVFDEFEIEEDLSNGGATVRLPGLTPGAHEFSCGMRMVHGTVVAAI